MQLNEQATVELSGLSHLQLTNVKTAVGRQDRTKVMDPGPDYAPLEVLKKYALNPERVDETIETLRSLEGDDGMPYNRMQADFTAAREQLDNYLKPEVPNRYYDSDYRRALDFLKEEFRKLNLLPETVECEEQAKSLLTNLDSSSGWEGIIENKFKKRAWDGMYYLMFKQGIKLLLDKQTSKIVCIGKVDTFPNFLNRRFKRKLRLVSPVTLSITLVARMFAIPLDHVLHSMFQFGPGKDDSWLTAYITRMRQECMCIVRGDYSKYDSTIPSWLIRDAFNIMYLAFEEGSVDKKLWDAMVEDFITKTFIYYEDGVVKADTVHHGNVSGHPFTTLVNCICNALIQLTVAAKFHLDIMVNITGDDYLMGVRNYKMTEHDCEVMCEYVTRFFGIKLTSDGTTLYDQPKLQTLEYLSREWTVFGPARDYREIVDKMAFPRYARHYESDGGTVKPEHIVYAAVLTYPVTMRQVMRVDDFLVDCGLSPSAFEGNRKLLGELPYNIQTLFDYYGHGRRTPDMDLVGYRFDGAWRGFYSPKVA